MIERSCCYALSSMYCVVVVLLLIVCAGLSLLASYVIILQPWPTLTIYWAHALYTALEKLVSFLPLDGWRGAHGGSIYAIDPNDGKY